MKRFIALVTHPHHNYSYGRNKADITSWLDYFLRGMAGIFEQVAEEVAHHSAEKDIPGDSAELLRQLDVRARRVLGLFLDQEIIRSADVAGTLGVSPRQARNLLGQWVEDGWLVIVDPSNRGRRYQLAGKYQSLL